MTTKALLENFTLLDGAFGTVLQSKDLKPGDVPELLNLENPDIITEIYNSYIDAGSDIIYANTFGANPIKLSRFGLDCKEIITAGVSLAKRASYGKNVLVALDIGPLGQLLEPMGTLTFEEAYEAFKTVVKAGRDAGADLVVAETLSCLYEAKAALLAAKENSDLPVFVTMSYEERGRTFTGCTVPSMAHTLEGLGADAIGFNCSLGPDKLSSLVAELSQNTSLPIIVKPNAGLPDPADGHYNMTPKEFCECIKACIQNGATIIGGCCGTNPNYIKQLKETTKNLQVPSRNFSPSSFICTPTNPLKIDGVKIIGERINPTGKKRFQQALLEGDLDYILDVAVSQVDAGAQILDVNVGFPGVDEEKMLPKVVKKIQSALDVPLQLDSSNPAALEAALRIYNGKAAVNSVNNDEQSKQSILPIVKKYGASVVGLTLDSSGLAKTALERIDKAKSILKACTHYGIAKEDVWIDCLTLTVSAEQNQAKETLKAVKYVSEKLGLKTVLGVSNISFGLPERAAITQCFLSQALYCGLTLPIINPNQKALVDTVFCHNALSCSDISCTEYVNRFTNTQSDSGSLTLQSTSCISLTDAIQRGLCSECISLSKEYLKDHGELSLIEEILIPSLDEVGKKYESGKAFLPQLLSAATAAQSVFEVIKTYLSDRGKEPIKKGALIIATVKGDIHDIGKNIVKTILENYGYDVIDLGKDVPAEVIYQKALETNTKAVGLSALMTTTLPAMKQTIELLKTLPTPPKTIVGGAVLTAEYAKEIGADFYAKDANDAVEIAKKILG